MHKEITVLGVITTPYELFHHSAVNFIYGVLSWLPATFLVLNLQGLFAFSVLGYYTFLSIVLNRKAYETKLGKYIIFPFSSASGAFVGYKLGLYIQTLL